jgi:hypothetical protein
MTAQVREKLIYNGVTHWMASEPLSDYLKTRPEIRFAIASTACWRGYCGTWEIIDDELYLVELEGKIKGYVPVGVSHIFPGRDYVFASWFTGSIRIPHGKMLKYAHAGYFSIFEKDLFMEFENGVLKNQYEIDNVKEFEEGLIKREQEEKDKILLDAKKHKKDKIIINAAAIVAVMMFFVICYGLKRYYQMGTILSECMSIWMFLELLLIYGGAVYWRIFESNKSRDVDRTIILIGINLIIFFLIALGLCIYYSIQMNTIWGNLIAGTLSFGVLCFAFLVIRASLQRRKKAIKIKLR